jgi:hypothetical protein
LRNKLKKAVSKYAACLNAEPNKCKTLNENQYRRLFQPFSVYPAF